MATRRNRVASAFFTVAAHAAETTPRTLASFRQHADCNNKLQRFTISLQPPSSSTCLALLARNGNFPRAFATCALPLFGRHLVALHVSYPCATHNIPCTFTFLTRLLCNKLFPSTIWTCNTITCGIPFLVYCVAFFHGIIWHSFCCIRIELFPEMRWQRLTSIDSISCLNFCGCQPFQRRIELLVTKRSDFCLALIFVNARHFHILPYLVTRITISLDYGVNPFIWRINVKAFFSSNLKYQGGILIR